MITKYIICMYVLSVQVAIAYFAQTQPFTLFELNPLN